ncbi:fungal-specific transcription factor domain-containing protein [Cantharellus anzutake]|uniref:fungal-specific transcription factor domain-containing protein n=1 Tax=Cantharellus anzutake TaxID=1750568 RepID=UPI001907F5C1|nr:fungal-specific transcription factor domain-containing protein [Cantharellus anzutake]KAF8335379.1 fungal-specific transcription factor domain-containing protein [Cantharellus anzutake]
MPFWLSGLCILFSICVPLPLLKVMRDQAFRFILEDPNADPSRNNQRKRARLVTACDSWYAAVSLVPHPRTRCRSTYSDPSRAKKIKCVTSSETGESPKCDACALAATPCLFSDRDRYHAERGVSMSEKPRLAVGASSAGVEDLEPTRRRKRQHSSPLTIPQPNGPGGFGFGSTTSHAHNEVQSETYSPPHPVSGRGALRRITVPFFRYFGPTANTSGYCKAQVHALTLPDDATATDSDVDVSASTPSQTRASLPPSILGTLNDSNTYKNGFGPALDMNFPNYLPVHADYFGGLPIESVKTIEPAINRTDLFDPQRIRYPSSEFLMHLITLFFDRMACHFPFLKRETIVAKVREGSLSAILANCICGLAARFSDKERLLVGGSRGSAGEPYCDMAKSLLVHMLSWPSLEILQSLILIAWAEFGSGRDSGLWMYSRMAVGMAMDLGFGFETTVQMASSNEDREAVRLTWWAVVLIDRINSWGTGRPIAIPDNQFDTALPSCDPSVGEHFTRAPPASFVFGNLCCLVQLRGKMGDILNNLVKRKASEHPVDVELSELQSQMVNFYQSLPPSLVFTIQNFRRFSNDNQAATFLLMHLMFHSVIILLQRPALLRSFSPNVTLPIASNVDLSRSSARSIVDMVLLANEVDENSLLANPFLDLPILAAARGFLAERELVMKPPSSTSSMVHMHQLQWSESNLGKCKEILARMSTYWEGVGVVKRILDQQSSGVFDFDVGEGNHPDSRLTHLRDVELMKQWATSSWCRHKPHGHSGGDGSRSHSGGNSSPRGPAPHTVHTRLTVPPLLPLNHNKAQYGSTPINVDAERSLDPNNISDTMSVSDVPEGAALGITGFLDGALVFDSGTPFGIDDESVQKSAGSNMLPSINGNSSSDLAMLRVSFNAAEADLSFGDRLSNELFNIPEGFEEFLGNYADHFVASSPPSANGESDPFLSRQHGSAVQAVGRIQRTDVNTALSKTGPLPDIVPEASHHLFPFASLGLPLGQFSRTPSPWQK